MRLKQVALYAKNWYKRTDVIEDLKKVLEADDYTPDNKFDIANILIANVGKLFSDKSITDAMMELVNGVSPQNCWKSGYYTKDFYLKKSDEVLPEYDYYTAVIYFFLSKLAHSTIDKLDGLPKANKKVLPLRTKK